MTAAPSLFHPSLKELFALEDDDDLLVGLFDFVRYKLQALGESALSPSEHAVLAVKSLDDEIHNGGFHQFFWNSSGDFAQRAVTGLELIGARATADIAARAVAVFKAPPPAEREARQAHMETWGDAERAALEALDGEFYSAPNAYLALLAVHCRRHRHRFSTTAHSGA